MTRINSLEEIALASVRYQCVVSAHHPKPMPAAFLMSMQARVVLRWIKLGLFVYVPKHKTKPKYVR